MTGISPKIFYGIQFCWPGLLTLRCRVISCYAYRRRWIPYCVANYYQLQYCEFNYFCRT